MIIRCPPLSSFFFGVGVGLGSGGGFGAGGDGGGGVGGSGSGSGVGPSFGNVSSTLLHVPCISTAMARAVSPRCTPSMTPSSTAITHAVVWKRRGRERTRPIASFGVPRSLPHVHLQTHLETHPQTPRCTRIRVGTPGQTHPDTPSGEKAFAARGNAPPPCSVRVPFTTVTTQSHGDQGESGGDRLPSAGSIR